MLVAGRFGGHHQQRGRLPCVRRLIHYALPTASTICSDAADTPTRATRQASARATNSGRRNMRVVPASTASTAARPAMTRGGVGAPAVGPCVLICYCGLLILTTIAAGTQHRQRRASVTA